MIIQVGYEYGIMELSRTERAKDQLEEVRKLPIYLRA
jgi:hypothetical protein